MSDIYLTPEARLGRAEARVAVLEEQVFAVGVRQCPNCAKLVQNQMEPVACTVCRTPTWPVTERSLRLRLEGELIDLRKCPPEAVFYAGARWKLSIARAFRAGVESAGLDREARKARYQAVSAWRGPPEKPIEFPTGGGDAA